MVNNKKSEGTANLSWLNEDINERLSSKEDTKVLWKVIFNKSESGGEQLIAQRLRNWGQT